MYHDPCNVQGCKKAAQEKSGNDEPPNVSMGNKTVDGNLVTPTSRDLQEMNDFLQPSHDVQPLSLSPSKLVVEHPEILTSREEL